MSVTGLLISLLYLLLQIAIICFVAWVIVAVLQWFGIGIHPEVYRWGKIIVALLIIIAIVVWVVGAVGGAAPRPLVPTWRW